MFVVVGKGYLMMVVVYSIWFKTCSVSLLPPSHRPPLCGCLELQPASTACFNQTQITNMFIC